MSRLSLNAGAYIRLQAQVTLSGTFNHTLHTSDGRHSVPAQVEIEQCTAGITVMVRICGTRNTSVTLDKHRKNNATRVANFIEGIANGISPTGVADVDEHEAVSDIEATLRLAIRRGRGIYHLIADDTRALSRDTAQPTWRLHRKARTRRRRMRAHPRCRQSARLRSLG